LGPYEFWFIKKVAGAAMKRSRKGVLLQGTIIMDKSWKLNREKFQESLIHFISEMLKETTDPGRLAKIIIHPK
jgi:lipoate-protein ligase A